MLRQEGMSTRTRRSIPRAAASMRMRVAVSRSSASASSRALSRSRDQVQRLREPFQRIVQRGGGFREAVDRRLRFGFERKDGARFLRPCMHLLAHQSEEFLRRAARLAFVDACCPSRRRKRRGGGKRRHEGLLRQFVAGDEVADALVEAASPSSPLSLGAPDPASQLRRFEGGKRGGKGAVRRIEDVVPLVEHESRACFAPAWRLVFRPARRVFRLCGARAQPVPSPGRAPPAASPAHGSRPRSRPAALSGSPVR